MSEFIKLQLKLAWGGNKSDNKKSVILTGFFGILVIAVMLVLVYYLTSLLKDTVEEISPKQLSVFFLTIIQASLTFMGITMQLKRLYHPDDLHISSRFPLTAFKTYISNVLIIFINLTIYSLLLVAPVMIIVNIAMGTLNIITVFGILLCALMSSLMPFAFSTIIAIPVMFVLSLLENRNFIKLAIFVCVLIAFFILYNYIIQMLADYFINKGRNEDTKIVWTKLLNGFNYFLNPVVYLGEILYFDRFFMAMGIVIAIFVVFSAIGLWLARIEYSRVRNKLLDGVGKTIKHKTKINDAGPLSSIFIHGFKEIFRTKAYAYFYLGIAIATPVMVFFCNRLVMNIGKEQIGGIIGYGASVLVISAFMAMISAFSANCLSMEGKNFYITKLVPINYRFQLFVKGFINFMVSFGALLFSCIVLCGLHFLTVAQSFIIGFTEIVLAIGLVLNGININLSNPNLKQKSNGEADEINITVMMVIGLVLSVILGAIGIIFMFFLQPWIVYVILFSIVLVYAVINMAIFLCTAEKRYYAIEF